MKQRSKWIRWISFLFTVVAMYIAFQLFAFIASEKTSQLQNHLPAGASLVLKVNNPNIFKRFAYDFLFISGIDSEDFQNWDPQKSRKDLPVLGINATQELFVFKEDWNSTVLFGAIVHLNNPKNFINFLSENEEIVGAVGPNNIGIILLLPKDISESERERFQQYALDLTTPTRDRFKSRIALSNSPTNTLLHLFYDGGSQSFIQNLDLTMTMKGSNMHFNGVAIRNPIFEMPALAIPLMQRNKTAGEIELRTISFPDTIGKIFERFYSELGVNIVNPNYHHIFYRGMKIVDDKTQTKLLPNMDILIHADSVYFSAGETLDIGQEMEWEIYKETYFLYRYAKNSLYIGKQSRPDIEENQLNQVLFMTGDPAVLLLLEGNSFFVQIIQILPPFRHAKNWLSEMQRFEFSGSLIGQDRILVEGVVGFQDDKTASYELLKFLLNF
ncbi:MAG: hypothetical protein JJT77_05625 [Crocinitomicaceae bacterium]|nr:hypothetical protein [Crocinitomicaceae bacterium]